MKRVVNVVNESCFTSWVSVLFSYWYFIGRSSYETLKTIKLTNCDQIDFNKIFRCDILVKKFVFCTVMVYPVY